MNIYRGETRIVLQLGGVVLKVAKNIRGVAFNVFEYVEWLIAPSDRIAQTYLTTLLFNIQKYAGTAVDVVDSSIISYAKSRGILDVHSGNVAYDGDSQRIIDYGFTRNYCALWCHARFCDSGVWCGYSNTVKS